jgi:hypothetical protein
MFSWEITQIMESTNFNIDSKTYLHMCSTSPQINHIVYDPYSNNFEMWDEVGEHWIFTVYNKENKGEL